MKLFRKAEEEGAGREDGTTESRAWKRRAEEWREKGRERNREGRLEREGQRFRRPESNLILQQYKLLIMRPAFTCLLIGPPCLLGKIDRSHDRPSLTPNALRARQAPLDTPLPPAPTIVTDVAAPSLLLLLRIVLCLATRIWTCRKSCRGVDQFRPVVPFDYRNQNRRDKRLRTLISSAWSIAFYGTSFAAMSLAFILLAWVPSRQRVPEQSFLRRART